jgi:hypothetical protein
MKRLAILLCILLLAGCISGQTYTEQIRDQGGTPFDLARAGYLDSLKWYNDQQENFIQYMQTIPASMRTEPEVAAKLREINDLFVIAGLILDDWRLTNDLIEMDYQSEEFRRARNALIDAGILMLVK